MDRGNPAVPGCSGLFQGLEFAVHTVLGTTAFRSGLFASAAVTGLSALFNLFAMRRGALLVGGESNPFSKDLCDLPRLALQFLLAIPVNVARFFAELRSSFLPGRQGMKTLHLTNAWHETSGG